MQRSRPLVSWPRRALPGPVERLTGSKTAYSWPSFVHSTRLLLGLEMSTEACCRRRVGVVYPAVSGREISASRGRVLRATPYLDDKFSFCVMPLT